MSKSGTSKQGKRSSERTVTVTATGRTPAVPDVVTVSVGVQVRGASAREALGGTNDKTQAAIEAFRAGGVEDRDIGTASITIWPEYGDQRRVEAYQAQNTLSVRLRDVGTAGGVLDAVANVIGDDLVINGISFSVSDPDAALSRARTDAMARARAQAELLAASEGATVGKALAIHEGLSGSPLPPSPKAGRMMMAAQAMPVEPGEQELAVTVTVAYELR